ncbi:RHS repeat-associated core domain-containing protein [Pseudomonas sp. 3A(2025)]
MTASTSVHSNALNFMSLLDNAVDPRTGQYTVSIKLPELATNDLRGPHVPLALGYDPLNRLDTGFGVGWNLQLSQFDPRNRVIALSTGETFKASIDGDNGRLLMPEQKLDSFRLYMINAVRYEVVHKSGVVEVLGMRGDNEHGLFVPVEIHSPIGHRVTLEYSSHAGYPLLNLIKDAADNTVLRIRRTTYDVEVQVQPYAGPAGTPLASFVMRLDGRQQVTHLVLPTENQACWRFQYSEVLAHWCITSVDTPTGAHEDLYYLENGDQGHQFPRNSGRASLPRVTRHVLTPGADQPAVQVRYSYPGSHNFLGSGMDVIWDDSGLDNMYQQPGVYLYKSTESLYQNNTEVRRIERTFNQFHLLILQETTQGTTIQTIETEYHMDPNALFRDQENQCQLPRQIKTQWKLSNDTGHFREEIVATTFDEHGNLIRELKANGIEEVHTWYPADGSEDGCPAYADNFVRYRQSTTVTPANSTKATPTLCTRYRYTALPVLTGSRRPSWLTRESESQWRVDGEEKRLQHHAFSYSDTPDNPLTHGQVSRETVTLNGLSTFSDYRWRKLANPDLSQPRVETTQTVTCDFDATSKVMVREQSTLTGLETSTLVDGVNIVYRYDPLGRVIEETIAPETPDAASRTYSYFLCANTGEKAEQTVRNARQVRTRTVLDGLGRAVLEARDRVDSDASTQMRTVYEARYNALGQLQQQTHYDWHDGQSLALDTEFAYDDWNEQRCETGPDGIAHHKVTYPTGTPGSNGPIQRTWIQSPGAQGEISSLTETWMNLFGKPSKIRALSRVEEAQSRALVEVEVSREDLIYDGLGRCIEQHDELRLVTRFTYDEWSRMTETRLPDQTLVRRTYALHSAEELPVKIEAGDTVDTLITVGEQDFDGLGRVTRLSVGPRTERFSYNAGEDPISQRITAAGTVLDYTYNLQLTSEPTAIIADNAPSARFEYDPTSARITSAHNALGQREYTYDIQNQLRVERWIDAAGDRWETLYGNSLQGRPHTRTELKRPDSNGLETEYTYDTAGRIETVKQDVLRTTLAYNTLGQVWRTTTQDLAADTRVVIEQTYDDQGREIKRTLKGTHHPLQTLTQSWRVDGLLDSRQWLQGTVNLLSETFEYDMRGRLEIHTCTGSQLPRDELNRPFTQQAFHFDALDNLLMVGTTLEGIDRPELTSFDYDEPGAPCQLTGVRYSPARPEGNTLFRYDDNGNQLNDRQGQALSYDTLGRLTGIQSPEGQAVGRYGYDSHDQLVTSQQGNAAATLRFYQDNDLSCAVQGDRQVRLLHGPQGVAGQQQVGDDSQNLLLMGDANGSVRVEQQVDAVRTAVYSAYGERYSRQPLQSLTGYNGEVQDPASGWYLLGKGYRAYEPGLMRFHSPDSLSPFGSGGLNPYTYCLGNPIALRDPTGHRVTGSRVRLSGVGMGGSAVLYNRNMENYGGGGGWGILTWALIGFAAIITVGGIAATIITFGEAFPYASGAIAGTVGAATASATGSTAAGVAATAVVSSVIGATTAAAGTGATYGTLAAVVTFASLAASEAAGVASFGLSTAGMAMRNRQLMQFGDHLGYASMALGLSAMAVGIGKGIMKRLSKGIADEVAANAKPMSSSLRTVIIPMNVGGSASVLRDLRSAPGVPSFAAQPQWTQAIGARPLRLWRNTDLMLPAVGGEKVFRKFKYMMKTSHSNPANVRG